MPTPFVVQAVLLGAGLVVAAPPEVPVVTNTAMVQRSYPIADLVVPLTRAAATMSKPSDRPESLLNSDTAEMEQADRFCQLLVQAVEPGAWPKGGHGCFNFESHTRTLLVRQTPAVHEKIAALLEELRKTQEVEVQLEVRFLTISEASLQRIDLGGPGAPMVDDTSHTTRLIKTPLMLQSVLSRGADRSFLDDQEVRLLLEAVQGDRSANVMQAPKMTLVNGQMATMEVGDRQYFVTGVDVVRTPEGYTARPKNEQIALGIRLTAQPVVSPDHRIVQLYFKLEESELASSVIPIYPVTVPVVDTGRKVPPFTQFVQQPNVARHTIEKTSVAIPDGQTLLFSGRRKVRQAHVENVNPLAKLPLVGQLFRDNRYHPEMAVQELILVTPRVVTLRDNGTPANPAATQQAYQHLQQLAPGSRFADLAVATLNEPGSKPADPVVQTLPTKNPEPLVQHVIPPVPSQLPASLPTRPIVQTSHVEPAPAANGGVVQATYLEPAAGNTPAKSAVQPAVNNTPAKSAVQPAVNNTAAKPANADSKTDEISSWRRTEVMIALRKAYREARMEGRTAEAERIAQAMRAVDPYCSLEEPK
jgi:hypothetical protein